MGHLFAILMHPLTGHPNRHPPLVVDIPKPCFRLQVGMLLEAGTVLALDNDIGLFPASLNITVPDAIMNKDVVLSVRMELWRAIRHGF